VVVLRVVAPLTLRVLIDNEETLKLPVIVRLLTVSVPEIPAVVALRVEIVAVFETVKFVDDKLAEEKAPVIVRLFVVMVPLLFIVLEFIVENEIGPIVVVPKTVRSL
jgi:hypothetical protein